MNNAILNVAFKGKGNSSNRLVSELIGEKLYLTNSVNGLKRDIESYSGSYSIIYMFGLDKSLCGSIRIEQRAVHNNEFLSSTLDLRSLAYKLTNQGISTNICDVPNDSLCNEAYWHMLKKYAGNVVFLHIPSIKYITLNFISKVQASL